MILPFIIHIPLIFFLAYFLRKRYSSEPLINYYWPGLFLKITAGISVGLIYTYYYKYGGDTFNIHLSSSILTDLLFKEPSQYLKILFLDDFNDETKKLIYIHNQPRVLFYAKLLSILNIFTYKNYYINGFYLSFFSFSGFWFLGNSLVKIFNTSKSATAFSFLFFPSFVFWTSGVLKESFVIGSMAFIIFISLKYIHLDKKINYKNILILLPLLYCVWKIKFFYLMVLIPCILSYYFVSTLQNKFEKLRYNNINGCILFLAGFFLISATAISIHPSINISYLANAIYENYTATLKISDKIDFIFPGLKPDPVSILLHTPQAFLIGLFRPFIWESAVNITLLAALENLVILLLFITQVFFFLSKKQPIKLTGFTVAFYIFILAAFMAMISPNWGTLSRYKVSYLPFLILLLTNNNPLFNLFAQKIFRKIKNKI